MLVEQPKPHRKSVSSAADVYYHKLTSSLNKRPMGIIVEEETRKKCGVKKQVKPILVK
jgi:hypothetical protein